MMLPKTACANVFGTFNKTAQIRIAKPIFTNRFAIPPLLADPFPASQDSPSSNRQKLRLNKNERHFQSLRALSIGLNVTKEGQTKTRKKNEPGSTAKGTPR